MKYIYYVKKYHNQFYLFLKRTIFNKNISNKQNLENFGVGQIKNIIFSPLIKL